MITKNDIADNFIIDLESGVIFWKGDRANNKIKDGSIAGSICNGYVVIDLFGVKYKAHRLIWFYVYGYMPSEIDHIDHNRSNNAISNLREVSRKENSKNHTKQSNNTSGHVGVRWKKNIKRYIARIGVNGRDVWLGSFTDVESAINARRSAERKYSFHKNHGK